MMRLCGCDSTSDLLEAAAARRVDDDVTHSPGPFTFAWEEPATYPGHTRPRSVDATDAGPESPATWITASAPAPIQDRRPTPMPPAPTTTSLEATTTMLRGRVKGRDMQTAELPRTVIAGPAGSKRRARALPQERRQLHRQERIVEADAATTFDAIRDTDMSRATLVIALSASDASRPRAPAPAPPATLHLSRRIRRSAN